MEGRVVVVGVLFINHNIYCVVFELYLKKEKYMNMNNSISVIDDLFA
jgi:hypothetical protein